MAVLRPTRFLLLVVMTGCTGLRQSPDDVPAADIERARDADAPEDATPLCQGSCRPAPLQKGTAEMDLVGQKDRARWPRTQNSSSLGCFSG